MRNISILLSLLLSISCFIDARCEFEDQFDGRTLRLDYIFAGNDSTSNIYLSQAGKFEGWYGRRTHLDHPLLRGNGAVILQDKESGDTIYANSFSTLFQEWQNYDEARSVARSFEHTVLVPMPRRAAIANIELYDNRGNVRARMSHPIDPEDILIRDVQPPTAEYRYVHRGDESKNCVDLVVLAEGYTEDELDKFFKDAERAAEALFSHEPFASMSDKFNMVAVATPSQGSGPSMPGKGDWHSTAHQSHYDTFYMERYLTTRAIHGLYDAIGDLPCEHIILMVNTPRYGGGGIFNQVTVATSDHPTFKQVLVHEFGHAYAGLADEYFYDETDSDRTYPVDVEPWEPNITTLVDFGSKWKDMMPGSPEQIKQCGKIGLYEGGGYKTHGIYRPVDNCRMRVNDVDYFCPVCTRAIIDITNFYTGD